MLGENVKNGVGQGFIFHAIISHYRQRGCNPHPTWSQQSPAPPAQSVNPPPALPLSSSNVLKFTRFPHVVGGCLPFSSTIYFLVKVLLV